MRVCYLSAVFALLSPTQGLACDRDSLAVRLPGETEEQFQKRENAIYYDNAAWSALGIEKYSYSHAPTIYVAKVVKEWDYKSPRIGPATAVVHPVKIIKGQLPASDRTLIDQNTGGRCSDRGDGSGARARVGELVIVFENLPKNVDRPNGIESIQAGAIRTDDLLVELAEYLGVNFK